MANISFSGLDQDFYASTHYTANSTPTTGFEYSYNSQSGSKWDFDGSNITTDGNLPTGGTITGLQLDLNSDDPANPELVITGLPDVPIAGLNIIGSYSYAFWAAILSGNDTIDLSFVDPSASLTFWGDGERVDDGLTHVATNDVFTGGAALSGFVFLTGDFGVLDNGNVTGGDDQFLSGASAVYGDFNTVFGLATAVGGDDVFMPAVLTDSNGGGYVAYGDALSVNGQFTGGHDFFDLRSTDVSGLSNWPVIYGDVSQIGGGSFTGGNDTVHGSIRNDQIYGDYIVNFVSVVGGNDWLAGYAGNDTIWGNEGDDSLLGGDNSDLLNGGAGADLLDGGAGVDIATYSHSASSVSVSLEAGIGFSGESAGDTLTAIEYLDGGQFDDTLEGTNSGANRIRGSFGDDFLKGLSGNDTLNGGYDDDTLLGGLDFDSLDGGDGLDSLDGGDGDDFANGELGDDTIVGAAGDDTLKGDDGNDRLFAGIGDDRADGGLGDDLARTSNGRDTALGGDGDDTLGAGSGTDLLNGNAGADLLLASNGNDRLFGGDGDDTMLGGGGRDTLTGGAGDDRLVGGAENDGFNFNPGSGADWIVDFEEGAASGDIIRLIGFGAAFDDFADVLAASTQVGANVVIDLGGGDQITLQGVALTGLDASDFAFG